MPEQQGSPDQNVPQLWDESKALDPASAVIYQLLLIQAFRPLVTALVTLLLQSIYGAKIDNDFDQRRRSFVAQRRETFVVPARGQDIQAFTWKQQQKHVIEVPQNVLINR